MSDDDYREITPGQYGGDVLGITCDGITSYRGSYGYGIFSYKLDHDCVPQNAPASLDDQWCTWWCEVQDCMNWKWSEYGEQDDEHLDRCIAPPRVQREIVSGGKPSPTDEALLWE